MHSIRLVMMLSVMLSASISFNSFAAEAAATNTEASAPAQSSDNWWQRAKTNLSQTWHASDNHDIYVPAITWHNRWTYSDEKIDEYNERPWGAGYGISRFDADGDWHGLYIMAFKDSHNKWEPIGGYGFEKMWTPTRDRDFRLGLGFTAGVTMRDNWDYIPIPVLLPLASVNYKQLSFQATYIPGTRNNGNVFFAWFRWQL